MTANSIAWATVEDAIVAWLEGSTGLRAAWNFEGGVSLEAPYISVQLNAYTPRGHDWKRYESNPSPTEGQEILVKAQGMRQATIIVECWGEGRKGQTPAINPLPLLAQAIDALELYVTPLDAAGVGIGEVTPIQLAGKAGTILSPRARCEIGIHLASEVQGFEAALDRVQITTRVGDEIEVDTWIPDEPPP